MSTDADTLTTVAEAEGEPPEGRKVYKRWATEIALSSKGEKDWRETAGKLYGQYRGKDCKKNSYNIFWANTEITRAATYNSLPKPDVRRRFKDKDPLGKVIGEALKRSLEYTLDVYHYHDIFSLCVLDMLIVGRGVMRMRYKPTMKGDAVSWECVMPEHVQWDDFRHGAGKTPKEWRWKAFKHRLTRDELVGMFGEEIGRAVQLDGVDDDDDVMSRLGAEDEVKASFKTAEVWEIWDDDKKRVVFISSGYPESPLLDTPDPLGIDEFCPMPEPIYAIEDSETTTPTPMFELYRQQADELDRISYRINKIVEAIKFRGIYDSTITEMAQLMEAPDNEFIPAGDVSGAIERGGLEKGIWTWPVNVIAQVLQYLYDARDRCKAVIYELTGISDIVRGSTKASETLGAQQLKAEYAGLRIGRIQANVQRFIRDAVRICGGIIAEKVSSQTIMGMTNLQLPTEQDIQQKMQQAMMQWQKAAQMAQQQGQQPPPQPQLPQGIITVEALMQGLRSNMVRSYKVDIETDSTIQQTVDSDMQALGQLGQSINMIVGAMGPMVQEGVMPAEAMKELVASVARRAKLGNAVEDALDTMGEQQGGGQAQLQEAQKEMQQAQQQLQQEQQQLQQEQQKLAQDKAALEMDAAKKSSELQMNGAIQTAEVENDRMKLKNEAAAISGQISLAEKNAQMEGERQVMAIEKAMMKLQSAMDKLDTAMGVAEKSAADSEDAGQKNEMMQTSAMVQQTVKEAIAALTAPKQVTRDAQGRIAGVQTVGNAKVQ